jgi:signal transduction histidine kinase
MRTQTGLLRRLAKLAANVARPRTIRLRFTVLYGALFLLSGALALTIAGIVASASNDASRAVPGGPPTSRPALPDALAQAHARIDQLQDQLSQADAAQSHQILVGSAVALGVMAVVSIVLGRVVAGRALRPLQTMTAATRRISADNLHERLAVPGPADEVKDLADTIDELLERLEGAFAAQRRFAANASHELRTPLATMRASLDVAMAKPGPVPPQTIVLADRLGTALDQIDRLLEGLLALARTQQGALPDHTTLSLDHLASAALAARAVDIAANSLTVHDAIGSDDAHVQGSQALLRRMVDNVIDNGIDHNHRGGWIRVTTEADGASVRLVVETGGPVLDQQHVAQLAQPFRRLGADRTAATGGAGLGLSIVAAIASAHGGTLDLHARTEGGLRVSISVPRAGRTAAHGERAEVSA